MAKETANHSVEREGLFYYRKFVLALAGLPLVGKTTLGKELENRSNLTLLESDEARWEVFPEEMRGKILPALQEAFAMRVAHQRNYEKARDLLLQEKPVILTGTFSRQIYHDMIKNLSQRYSAPLKVIFLTCSDEEIKKRAQKKSADGTLSKEELLAAHYEVKNRYQIIQGVDLLEVNTEQLFNEYFSQVLNFISDLRA
ncbi:AAA family ATPase [Candidatus Curtissbacteria bacterium]|nr:AAA family ATPase [Candidatus Curtissbacteria bacterium]